MTSGGIFDLPKKATRLAELEALIAQPGFWENQTQTRDVMKEIARLKSQITIWDGLETSTDEAVELVELVDADDDAMLADVEREVIEISAHLNALEIQLLLSGEFDTHQAFLTIQSGAGGTESQDWAEMLLRMYSRRAERRPFRTEVVEISVGEEAGIKSATVQATM